MEYKTKVAAASGLLVILILTAVLGWAFSQQAVTARQAQEPLLSGFSAPAVTGIQIGDIVLSKAPAWGLSFQGKSFPASVDRIDTYLKTLSTLQRERLVTKDDGKAFGLESGFKTLKLLSGDKVLYELQVGGSNDLGDKAYVRFAGEKEIWQTNRGFARTLDMDFNTWADLSLFPGRKADELTRISFDSRIETSDKTVYAPFDLVKDLKNGKAVWQDRISKASSETMASWASLVAPFHFGAFAGPNESQPAAILGTVTATWSDGSTTTVKIGPPDDKNRYKAIEGTREFWIDDWALGQLLYK